MVPGMGLVLCDDRDDRKQEDESANDPYVIALLLGTAPASRTTVGSFILHLGIKTYSSGMTDLQIFLESGAAETSSVHSELVGSTRLYPQQCSPRLPHTPVLTKLLS